MLVGASALRHHYESSIHQERHACRSVPMCYVGLRVADHKKHKQLGACMPNRHIMVVEDDAAAREFMVDFLSMEGYEVTPWHTSSQAIE
ncbi:MAG: hypothetical protein AVDCRST_MAG93-1743, partial [uncultured Chloroflexia bacterium]